jgi:arylsulfatase A
MNKKEQIKKNMRKEAHREYLSSIQKLSEDELKSAPNIILILMDDLGWGDLSCFGSKAIYTPNIDRMAGEGTVLENCYASSPICTPSRFGLLTGRYPCRGHIEKVFFPTKEIEDRHVTLRGYEIEEEEENGKASKILIDRAKKIARDVSESLPVEGILEDEITIAEMLKARGYNTAMFGKWHLGDKTPHLPNDKGFDYFYGAHYSNDMYPYHFWRNKEIAVEAPFDQSKITDNFNLGCFYSCCF